jgi:hypothetical protein
MAKTKKTNRKLALTILNKQIGLEFERTAIKYTSQESRLRERVCHCGKSATVVKLEYRGRLDEQNRVHGNRKVQER